MSQGKTSESDCRSEVVWEAKELQFKWPISHDQGRGPPANDQGVWSAAGESVLGCF